MTIQEQLKELGASLGKSKNIRVVELNPTLKSDVISRMIREVTDYAAKNARSATVVVVSFVK